MHFIRDRLLHIGGETDRAAGGVTAALQVGVHAFLESFLQRHGKQIVRQPVRWTRVYPVGRKVAPVEAEPRAGAPSPAIRHRRDPWAIGVCVERGSVETHGSIHFHRHSPIGKRAIDAGISLPVRVVGPLDERLVVHHQRTLRITAAPSRAGDNALVARTRYLDAPRAVRRVRDHRSARRVHFADPATLIPVDHAAVRCADGLGPAAGDLRLPELAAAGL